MKFKYAEKENIFLNLFVFSIGIAVVLVLILMINGGITGKSIDSEDNNDANFINNEISCSDSDSKNYFAKGNINFCIDGDCESKEDFCSGKKLTEWYCDGEEKKFEEYECDYCDDGACLNAEENYRYSYSGSSYSSESSGSASAGTASASGAIYDLGELISEHQLSVLDNDLVKFSISNTEYILNIASHTPNLLTINTGINNIEINPGEDKTLDLNNDGANDIYIKLKSVNVVSGKINLMINSV